MEFIAGALVAIVSMLVTQRYLIPYIQTRHLKVSYRQSDIFEAIRPTIPLLRYLNPPKETQASKYEDSHKLKVVVLENQAYWIKNNSVFVAEVVDGNIDQEGAKVIDTMNMDKIQLDRLSVIIDKLTKGGTNDSGYTGIS